MENKFQLKPSDRASIDFAEEERKRVEEEGAIAHLVDLKDFDKHWKIAYDSSSSDADTNWGKTGGLTTGDYTSNKLATAKKCLVIANLNGSTTTFIIDMQTLINSRYEGWGLCQIAYDNNIGTFIRQCCVRINSAKTTISVSAGYYRFNTSSFDSGNSNYKIAKIYIGE